MLKGAKTAPLPSSAPTMGNRRPTVPRLSLCFCARELSNDPLAVKGYMVAEPQTPTPAVQSKSPNPVPCAKVPS